MLSLINSMSGTYKVKEYTPEKKWIEQLYFLQGNKDFQFSSDKKKAEFAVNLSPKMLF